MEQLAAAPRLTIDPEGRLSNKLLPALLGSLGLVRATGALDLTRRRLLRRFVLHEGCLELIVSNARDDRLLEWCLASERLELPDARLQDTIAALRDSPLCGARLIGAGLAEDGQVRAWLREQLHAFLEEALDWKDGRYKICAGRAPLDDEPTARWPAIEAALALARSQARDSAATRVPPMIVAQAESEALPAGCLSAAESELLRRCQQPCPVESLLLGPSAAPRPEIGVLLAAGLLVSAKSDRRGLAADAAFDVTEQELNSWLHAAREENLEQLLGLDGPADVDAVRQAYYHTVRRFHPDRFRSGPLASHHRRVEESFRLVHQALEVLTDPVAREAWRLRRERDAKSSPDRVAQRTLLLARQAASDGRRLEAVDLLEKAQASSPKHPDLELARALLLVSNPRRRAEAIAALRELTKAHPFRADITAALGLALERAGDRAVAAKLIARALSIDPGQLIARACRRDPRALKKVQSDPILRGLFAGRG
ncbi:MAG: DnaJ domain-containing protein [Acidobacteriota bacterium]|nr:MAG: DnaJ domain-containing protein [Acidobacteriota bacterium]